MGNVSQIRTIVKGVSLYPVGCHVPGDVTNPTGKGSGKPRGEITGFSADSRRRLRMALLTMGLAEPFRTFGLTVTVPWPNEWLATHEDLAMEEFRQVWHRFAVSIRRALPDCAIIYRVELQQRRAPHVHGMIYVPERRIAQDTSTPACGVPLGDPPPSWLLAACLVAWFRAVTDLHGGSFVGFARHGVMVEAIPDHGAMLRYMSDHASKLKQAQLGYKGKQWGFVNRPIMAKTEGFALPFPSEHARYVFLRLLRRATAYRKKAACVFGYKTLPNRRRSGVFFGHDSQVIRLYRIVMGETAVKQT